ncbi:MAG TPA: hypothetical protein VL137_06500 [Polyangiaceae bacterium]|nr:hypothetical protein [Polyangiaceae bacterium]
MATRLRSSGVEISTLVRDAIRGEYRRRIENDAAASGSDLVKGILMDLPDPPDLEPRGFSTQDRKAVQRHIQRRLRRRRG